VVCEGAFYANAAMKSIDLKTGQKILIYGASGAIGTALVRIAPSTTPARISRKPASASIAWWMRWERLHFSDAAGC
jgi:NADPH:quinone reductase-like Zn-dependent oxidoreductase